MNKTIRWGILSAANIAHKFANSNALVHGSEIIAVAARTLAKAQKFAAMHNIPKVYGSYQELLQDADIDAVYIATIHPHHTEWVKAALLAGKAVLCEKPLGMNAERAKECADLAQEKGVFLMEGIWTPFLPVYQTVKQWLLDQRIGKIRMVTAEFAFMDSLGKEGRLLNPALGGGCLLDLGIYTTFFAGEVLGFTPVSVDGVIRKTATGVDGAAVYTLQYENGAIASLSCGIDYAGANQARIYGEKGYIHIENFSFDPHAFLYIDNFPMASDYHRENDNQSFKYEISHVVECLNKNLIQSDVIPLDHTIKAACITDQLLQKYGITAPSE